MYTDEVTPKIVRYPIDIWDMHSVGHPICLTTNGFVKKDGRAVMGRGNALQAAKRFPTLPLQLGGHIHLRGNHVRYFEDYNVITFPVKRNWWEDADIGLIHRSARELLDLLNNIQFARDTYSYMQELRLPVYLPSPGTGNGRLAWESVEGILRAVFQGDPRIIVTVKP